MWPNSYLDVRAKSHGVRPQVLSSQRCADHLWHLTFAHSSLCQFKSTASTCEVNHFVMKHLWTMLTSAIVASLAAAESVVASTDPRTTSTAPNDTANGTSARGADSSRTTWDSTVRPDGSTTNWELTVLASGGSILCETTNAADGTTIILERVVKAGPL
ncbi:hypothetical protein ON010_g10173 [Phytophthora cinnamomi]|nr:hypothetical protein ON010_g10173 [Phytophthora cinnamomi]